MQLHHYMLSDRHVAVTCRTALDEHQAAVVAAAAFALEALVSFHPEDEAAFEAARLAPASAGPLLRPCALQRSSPGGPWETLEEIAGEAFPAK